LTNVSLEDARKEIVGGKHKIENEIGKKISFFSYPYGDRSYKRNT
jgi:peptidoglycan/xylan/chitin deacetylase (PgdA/CDA1 family)